MESVRPATKPACLLGAAAMCLVLGAGPARAAAAPPSPGISDLKNQANDAQNQLEQLTEQYNGLKVQLDQATTAAKVAGDNADRLEASYKAVQQEIGRLAATTYMHGGPDPALALATTSDPEAVLDQASTLNYFATQSGSRVQSIADALQAAVRSRKAAQDRAASVQALTAQLDAKKKQLEDDYNTARDTIAKRDPTQLGALPAISGGSSTAMQAVQWALRERGKPYVWGAAGPSTFDCSGLTMWAYGKVGISLPHYTGSQWNSGTHISRSQLEPGDLVFFYSDMHHMGMYIGNGLMVHAPHTGDVVRIAPIAGRPFAGAVRVA